MKKLTEKEKPEIAFIDLKKVKNESDPSAKMFAEKFKDVDADYALVSFSKAEKESFLSQHNLKIY